MLYLSITSILFLLNFISKYNYQLRNQIYYLVFILLFIFSTFRYQVGCDWYGYYHLFLKYKNGLINLTFDSDPISHLIFDLTANSGLAYPFVYIPFSIIFFIGIYFLARRQPNPLSFIILLFPILIINIAMSAVRQGAAIGIICIAFTAFIDRRPLMYAFFVILASAFHTSAIIFMLLLPFASGRYNNTRLAIASFLALPGLILLFSNSEVQRAISVYVGTGREAFGAIFRLAIISLTGFYFFLFIKNKWKNYYPKEYSLVSIGSIIMILSFILFPLSTIIFDRFGYYLIPIQAMIFARIPYLPFKKNHLLHSLFPYLGLLIFLLVWTQTSWIFVECYVPYKSWLFEIPEGNILKE